MGVDKGSGSANQHETDQQSAAESLPPTQNAAEGDEVAVTKADLAEHSAQSRVDSVSRMPYVLGVAGLLCLADLLSKLVIVANQSGRSPVRLLGGLIYLTETRNSGAAFSFAQGATLLFTLLAAGVVIFIVRSATRLRSIPWAVACGLVLGGAAGNLIDRIFRAPGLFRGGVVDWISILDPAGRVWPIFNLADAGIVVGGVTAILLSMSGYEMDRPGPRRGVVRRSIDRRGQ